MREEWGSAAFAAAYPEYEQTREIDVLRSVGYAQLEREVYLDYTGSGVASRVQYEREFQDLAHGPLHGNPHSAHGPSMRSTERVERTRGRVLEFFGAPLDEYTAIFTANASHALGLVGEAFPFGPDRSILQLVDNHNSVNGLRQYARHAKAPIDVAMCGQDMRVDDQDLMARLDSDRPGLFAYPAQSNFSGVKHAQTYANAASQRGWRTLLDTAAYVPNTPFNMRQSDADFAVMSFYKMFGYPTGVGCLIAKNEALAELRRPAYAGGTIWAVSSLGDWHEMAPGAAAFEDGTPNFLGVPALNYGLDILDKVGMETIATRTRCLTGWMLKHLTAMTHGNGVPVAEVYGPPHTGGRGATVSFNFLTPERRIVDERVVERMAADQQVCMRSGCFCNPGAGEVAFGLRREDLRAATDTTGTELPSFDEYLAKLGLQSAGAIRASLGIPSNLHDVQRFLQLADTFRDNRHLPAYDLPPRQHC